MNKQKYQLGILPKQSRIGKQDGAIDGFIVPMETIPLAEEAVIQFFALTNQPFELIEYKGFKNLYRSIGTTCLIESAGTLKLR